MYKVFQPIASANFLKMLEDSTIGKALIEKTGISAFKMLNRFKLNLPTESNPTAWLIEGDTKFSYYLISLFSLSMRGFIPNLRKMSILTI